MLCQKCQDSHAQFHLQMNMNGVEKQVHLCSTCYKAEKAKIGSAFGPSMSGFSNFNQLPMEDLFKKFIASDQKQEIHSPSQKHGGTGAFCAGPLRRVIQELLEDKIADLIIDQPNIRNFIAVFESNQLIVKNS